MFAVALAAALSATVASAGYAGGSASAGVESPAPCPASVGGLSLTTATIPQLRDALVKGRITSHQLVRSYMRRIHALNRRGPHLRPVIRTNPDAIVEADAADTALGQGHSFGPLTGIPVLLKDNLDTKDLATTAGAKAMRGRPPPRNAFLVARLRQAGAIVLGKANMDEWATSISDPPDRQPKGFSDVGGQTLNPYTLGDPSGSSGGPAVAASSGLAGSTVGSETAGSVILPSYVNSAVGIKPTRGLISRGGVVPLLSEWDTPGPIDQNVTDAASMLGLMTGVDPRDPATRAQVDHAYGDYTRFLDPDALQGARIGIPKPFAKHPLFEITGLEKIKRTLEAQGATVIPVDQDLVVPPLQSQKIADAFAAGFRKQLNRYLRQRGRYSPRHSFAGVVAYNRRHPQAVRYGQALLIHALNLPREVLRNSHEVIADKRKKQRQAIGEAFSAHDLDALLVSRGVSSITNTAAGYPAITVPAGYQGRDPYGAIFTGLPWTEPKLIGYAYDFEQATHAWRSPATLDPKFAAACPA